jgi:hypothetical protein
MQRSTDRILTTFVGSLIRPPEVLALESETDETRRGWTRDATARVCCTNPLHRQAAAGPEHYVGQALIAGRRRAASIAPTRRGVSEDPHASLALGVIPSTPQGTLEVFESSAKDGSDINKVVVPITFGAALLDPYRGFTQDTVQPGDTLSAMAQRWYNDSWLRFTRQPRTRCWRSSATWS